MNETPQLAHALLRRALVREARHLACVSGWASANFSLPGSVLTHYTPRGEPHAAEFIHSPHGEGR